MTIFFRFKATLCAEAIAILILMFLPGGLPHAEAQDNSLYVTRTGTFLISRQPDPFENDYVRTGYAPIGTVLFSEGVEFEVRNKQTPDFRRETYVPVVTEGGIRAAALKDCLFDPGSSRLVVPQHFQARLSVLVGNTAREFSRSDGLFAEITGNDPEQYRVKFPFRYPAAFSHHCGDCQAENMPQQEGNVLKAEIEAEEAKIIIPEFYRHNELLIFRNTYSTVQQTVDALLRCMDGKLFPEVAKETAENILKHADRFYEFLTGCGMEAEADLALRIEFFGGGGGLTLAKEIKPRDRKLALALFELVDLDGNPQGEFFTIKRYECTEGKETRMVSFCLMDLSSRRSFDLLQKEVSQATDLVHVSKGDDVSRTAMFSIRENSGHDDVFKLYRFILQSRDFRKFVAVPGAGYDYRNKKVRAYLDFIVDQVADFRRSS